MRTRHSQLVRSSSLLYTVSAVLLLLLLSSQHGSAQTPPPTPYKVWVGTLQVTSENMDDVLGTGCVSFEPGQAGSASKLTLKEGFSGYLKVEEPLQIVTQGHTTVSGIETKSNLDFVSGTMHWKLCDLTVKSASTVTVRSGVTLLVDKFASSELHSKLKVETGGQLVSLSSVAVGELDNTPLLWPREAELRLVGATMQVCTQEGAVTDGVIVGTPGKVSVWAGGQQLDEGHFPDALGDGRISVERTGIAAFSMRITPNARLDGGAQPGLKADGVGLDIVGNGGTITSLQTDAVQLLGDHNTPASSMEGDLSCFGGRGLVIKGQKVTFSTPESPAATLQVTGLVVLGEGSIGTQNTNSRIVAIGHPEGTVRLEDPLTQIARQYTIALPEGVRFKHYFQDGIAYQSAAVRKDGSLVTGTVELRPQLEDGRQWLMDGKPIALGTVGDNGSWLVALNTWESSLVFFKGSTIESNKGHALEYLGTHGRIENQSTEKVVIKASSEDTVLVASGSIAIAGNLKFEGKEVICAEGIQIGTDAMRGIYQTTIEAPSLAGNSLGAAHLSMEPFTKAILSGSPNGTVRNLETPPDAAIEEPTTAEWYQYDGTLGPWGVCDKTTHELVTGRVVLRTNAITEIPPVWIGGVQLGKETPTAAYGEGKISLEYTTYTLKGNATVDYSDGAPLKVAWKTGSTPKEVTFALQGLLTLNCAAHPAAKFENATILVQDEENSGLAGLKCLGNGGIEVKDTKVTFNDVWVEAAYIHVTGASSVLNLEGNTMLELSGSSEGTLTGLTGQLAAGFKILEPTGAALVQESGIYNLKKDGVLVTDRVVIGRNATYPIWVKGTQVTFANRNDVLEDGGSVRLTEGGHVLLLAKDANISATGTTSGLKVGDVNAYHLIVRTDGKATITAEDAAALEIRNGAVVSLAPSGILDTKEKPIVLTGGASGLKLGRNSQLTASRIEGQNAGAYLTMDVGSVAIFDGGEAGEGRFYQIMAAAGAYDVLEPIDAQFNEEGHINSVLVEADGTTPVKGRVELRPFLGAQYTLSVNKDSEGQPYGQAYLTPRSSPLEILPPDALLAYDGMGYKLVVLPRDGYVLDKVTVNGTPLKGNSIELPNKAAVKQMQQIEVTLAQLTPEYGCTVSNNGGGHVEAKVDGQPWHVGSTIARGANVVFSAVAEQGFRCKSMRLNGALTTTPETTVLGVMSDLDVEAIFEPTPTPPSPTTSTLTIHCSLGCSVVAKIKDGNVVTDGATLEIGKELELMPKAYTGYHLVSLKVNGKALRSLLGASTLPITGNMVVEVLAKRIGTNFLLTVTYGGKATVEELAPLTGGGYSWKAVEDFSTSIDDGRKLKVTPEATVQGYQLKQVLLNGDPIASPYEFYHNSSSHVTVVFEEMPQSPTKYHVYLLGSQPTMLKVTQGSTSLTDGAELTMGSPLTITAAVPAEYTIDRFEVNGQKANTAVPYEIASVTGDVRVVLDAHRAAYLHIAPPQHGTLTVTCNSTPLSDGNKLPETGFLIIEAKAEKDYQLKQLLVNGVAATSNPFKLTLPSAKDVTVKAEFEATVTPPTPPTPPTPGPGPSPTPTPTAVDNGVLAQVEVWPNPMAEVLHMEQVEEVVRWQLIDLLGQVVAQGQLHGAPEQLVNVNSLPRGIYLLRLETANGHRIIRLVKA